MHDCKQTYDLKLADGTLVGPYRNYTCSRCQSCYVCKHKFVYFQDADKWMVKCRDGKFREVILDGKVAHD